MKRTILLCVTVLIAVVAISWKATTTSYAAGSPLFIEDFSYPASGLLTAHGWLAHSAGGTNAITVTSPGLTYSGYSGSGIGNAVSLSGSGEDDNSVFANQTSGTVYMAAMVNVSSASAAGDYFLHLAQSPVGSIFNGRVFVKSDGATGIVFGIAKANGTPVYTTTSFAFNTTYLIVVKYTIVAGATNDTADLFVNPNITAPNEPAPTATATDIASTADPASIGGVALRQGGASTAPSVRVDGIRVATNWTSLNAIPDANVDMNGDGKTDYVVVRGTGSPLTGDVAEKSGMIASVRQRAKYRAQLRQANATPQSTTEYWYSLINGTGNYSLAAWGDADTDVLTPEDYDGDGDDDIAVWRASDPAGFYILYTATNTYQFVQLGDATHDPTVVGDYDGDGKADPATYWCPTSTPGTCQFAYIGSNNNPSNTISYVQWGSGTLADGPTPAPGDYDGDGKFDFAVQRQVPGGNPGDAQFAILRSSDLAAELISWGVLSDTIEPGDFDGDGKTDIAVVRNQSGTLVHYILFRTNAYAVVNWGVTGDVPVPGDYDGDGRTDVAAYRPAPSPAPNTFYSLNIQNGSYRVAQWGMCPAGGPCDAPAANWNVH